MNAMNAGVEADMMTRVKAAASISWGRTRRTHDGERTSSRIDKEHVESSSESLQPLHAERVRI